MLQMINRTVFKAFFLGAIGSAMAVQSVQATLSDEGVNLSDPAAASVVAAGKSSTSGFPSTINSAKSLILDSAGKATVILNLQDLVLGRSAALTLKGDSNTVFIINVSKKFWLNSARINLVGGLLRSNVLFNYTGAADVRLSGGSKLNGIVLSSKKLTLSGKSVVLGKAIGGGPISLTGGSLVDQSAISL